MSQSEPLEAFGALHRSESELTGIRSGEPLNRPPSPNLSLHPAAAMNRCKTCKHWEPCAANPHLAPVTKGAIRGGVCRSDKLIEDWGQDYSADMLVYPYSEGGGFWTGSDFGCVHHK
jgi:hypothetical protein